MRVTITATAHAVVSSVLTERRPCVAALLVFALVDLSTAQPNLTWRQLDAPREAVRYNDTFFVNAETGWVVNGEGEIYRTQDGGSSWTRQLQQTDSHFRSVGFLTHHRGFAGNVGAGEFGASDMFPLYETYDGGQSWTPVPAWHGRTPTGLCGMQVVNDSTVVAVGRVRGPAFFARTTDGGATWRSKDMSVYAASLIDVFFTHPDTGFAVGLTNSNHDLSSGIILYTDDGGETWETRFRSSRTGEWCWKISFPSRRVGYVSLQRNSASPIFILKTTDYGATWEEKLFLSSHYFVQGIGFINEKRGWIGGNSTQPVYQTVDGGGTWSPETDRPRLNRFRFLGDTLGYAVGRRVHKLADWTATPVEARRESARVSLEQNYPEPFSKSTSIMYTTVRPGNVQLHVYDMLGRIVAVLDEGFRVPGTHAVEWSGTAHNGSRLPTGVYAYALVAGDTRHVRLLHIIR